jgi:hypothetical protein
MNQHNQQNVARDREVLSSMHTSSRLSAMNVANLLAYFASAFAFYGVGTFGLFGLSTIEQVSATYQSLVTPAPWTLLIWVFLYTFQFAWAIAQVLQDFRSMPLVTALGWKYIAVCACQMAWVVLFCLSTQESVCLSMVAIIGVLFFLFHIFSAQANVHAKSYLYWVLKFPMSLYYGWSIAVAVISLNVSLVAVGFADNIQYYIALASISSLMLVGCATSDLIVLLVLAWAAIGIYAEVCNPNNALAVTFDYSFIMWLQRWAIACFVIIMLLFVVRLFLFLRERKTTKSRRRDAGGGDDYNRMGDEEWGV